MASSTPSKVTASRSTAVATALPLSSTVDTAPLLPLDSTAVTPSKASGVTSSGL